MEVTVGIFEQHDGFVVHCNEFDLLKPAAKAAVIRELTKKYEVHTKWDLQELRNSTIKK